MVEKGGRVSTQSSINQFILFYFRQAAPDDGLDRSIVAAGLPVLHRPLPPVLAERALSCIETTPDTAAPPSVHRPAPAAYVPASSYQMMDTHCCSLSLLLHDDDDGVVVWPALSRSDVVVADESEPPARGGRHRAWCQARFRLPRGPEMMELIAALTKINKGRPQQRPGDEKKASLQGPLGHTHPLSRSPGAFGFFMLATGTTTTTAEPNKQTGASRGALLTIDCNQSIDRSIQPPSTAQQSKPITGVVARHLFDRAGYEL